MAGDRIAAGRAITLWRHPGSVRVVSDGELEPAQMIEDMLGRQTQHWEAAVTARARIDETRGAEPHSAVPAFDEWLAPFREPRRGIQLPFALPPAGS